MQHRLTEYLRKPDMLDAQAITQLRHMVERFPYNHSARILLLHALYRQHDPAFDAELRRSAPLLPNRQAIFHLIEEKNYRQDPARLRYTMEAEADTATETTDDLIDSFLSSLPSEPTASPRHTVDATQDYIGYMLQHTSEEEPDQAAGIDEDGIIDEFLQNETGRIVILPEEDDDTEDDVPEEPQADENEILTESLAHIYIKQGKFEKAIEIIRRLSLKYPKKNRYFADQIRFLEKLIINNKHK